MTVQITETQAKIIGLTNRRGGYSIEADVPAFGKFPTKFIAWEKEQGEPPLTGQTILGTFEPTMRQKRFVVDGTFDSETVDGSEMPWQVNWKLTGFNRLENAGSVEVSTTTASPKTTVSGDPRPSGGAVFIDANLRYRVDQSMINDRESIRMVIEHGKTADSDSIYTDVESVLAEAEKIAAWLNKRLEVRLGGGLVGALQEMGATVTKVAADVKIEPEVPAIKNEAELRDYVEKQGWKRSKVTAVINDKGYGSAALYLAESGNTVQGLAQLLWDNLVDVE